MQTVFLTIVLAVLYIFHSDYHFYIAENIQATNDLWVIGDKFLKSINDELEVMKLEGKQDAQTLPLFIQEYFNIHAFFEPHVGGIDLAIARITSTLVEAILERAGCLNILS